MASWDGKPSISGPRWLFLTFLLSLTVAIGSHKHKNRPFWSFSHRSGEKSFWVQRELKTEPTFMTRVNGQKVESSSKAEKKVMKHHKQTSS